ncbi:MAG TPA: prolyl oligopeptidase family serine peptidase, partial [Pyrinomonadaceae bacterium]|nr:prolyl oligopeptidase family serine peptidase [Pyrinomonadaceae bacterium]
SAVLTLTLLLIAFPTQAQIAGRYTDGKDYAVYFEQTKYGLTMRPVLWTATQLLRETERDRFIVVDRTSRSADFLRDSNGRIDGVVIRGMDGEGLKLLKAEEPLLPVELLLSGRVRESARGYLDRGEEGAAMALAIAEQVLRRLPTKTGSVLAFLNELAPRFRRDAKFHKLLGYAQVQAGQRKLALASFRRATALDPNDRETASALARLGFPQAKTNEGWTIPFPLSSVFARPTAEEIRAVEADWAARELSPQGIKLELERTVQIQEWDAKVRIVSHLVHGYRHFGAIIIPPNATPGCCPVIIEAKGVSPTYFPLTLENLAAPPMMGNLKDRFMYVIPSFRGEVLDFGGVKYQSEGDRTDALDGATDDTIAFLNVALQITPEADSSRICAFGQSRGGTVALLTGIRDRRIDCVVNWAGPTDWFYLMGTNGWTEQELWAEGLRNRANTLEPGGQNVERFLSKAIKKEADLKAVRHRMIASSPVYFAKRLPLSEHHYGVEDPSVPVRNGYELIKVLRQSGIPSSRHVGFFYPGQGHDTDRLAAPVSSRIFIANALGIR